MKHEERLAKNEILFRDVNERVREISDAEWSITERVQFLCECVRTDCLERLAIQLSLYERVRTDPTQFLVVPGHERLDVEDVIEETETYVIVQKRPETRRLVTEHDPRSN